MVRLRSDRWYSGEGQSRSRRLVGDRQSGSRRLISLCFLLALVILLMRKAADPSYVSSAFRSLGVPLESEEVDSGKVAATEPTASQSPSSFNPKNRPEDRWSATCSDLVPRLLAQATPKQIEMLSSAWFAVSTASTPKADELRSIDHDRSDSKLSAQIVHQDAARNNRGDSPEASAWRKLEDDSFARLETLAEHLDRQERAWRQSLQRFSEEWKVWWRAVRKRLQPGAEVGSSEKPLASAAPVDVELKQVVSDFLDQRLVESLADATPWKSQERLAFWRLLQKTQAGLEADQPGLQSASIPIVTTRRLEAEGAALKGNTIRFVGTIRRLEFVEKTDRNSGLEGYWLAWLRGADGSTQPVAVYSALPGFRELGTPPEIDADFPEVEVTAIVGKRLAYASQAGVQVAPTLFASQLIVHSLPGAESSGVQAVAGQSSSGTSRASPRTGWRRDLSIALIGGVILAGLLIVSLIRTRASGRPVRRGRSREIPPAVWLWCVYGLVVTAACSSHSACWAQEQQSSVPPWANASRAHPELPPELVEKLSSGLTPAVVRALTEFAENSTDAFPHETLQAVHILNQLGWGRARQLSFAGHGAEAKAYLLPAVVHGIVEAAEPITLTEAQQAWFQRDSDHGLFLLRVKQGYQLQTVASATQARFQELDVASQDELAVVCQQIPQTWKTAAKLRQPIRCFGFAVTTTGSPKPGSPESSSHKPVCVLANAVDWVFSSQTLHGIAVDDPSDEELTGASSNSRLTDATVPEEDVKLDWSLFRPSVPENLRLLGVTGWNLRLADSVVRLNQQPLRDSEAEAFYSLLRLMDSPKVAQAVAERAGGLTPLDALADPERSLGRAVRWPVRLVNGSLVSVDRDDDRSRLGTDRYFQFDGFVDLGNKRVRYQLDASQPQNEVIFEREFPITVVMKGTSRFTPLRRLQAGELSWSVGEFAEVEGCFYRIWSFQSKLLQRQDDGARQAAPLVVASRVRPSLPPIRPASGSEIGWFGWALCLATLLLLAVIVVSVANTSRLTSRPTSRLGRPTRRRV